MVPPPPLIRVWGRTSGPLALLARRPVADAPTRMPTSYVSTACRCDQHQDCEEHPVVLCACPCHNGHRSQPPWWLQRFGAHGVPVP